MKHLLVYASALLLLACMVYAGFRLDTADRWAPWWIPMVMTGVGLCLLGSLAVHRGEPLRNRQGGRKWTQGGEQERVV